MLLAPNVGEEEPSHIGESGNRRLLIAHVIGPEVNHEEFHEVILYSLLKPSDWWIEMYFYPILYGLSDHVLVQRWKEFTAETIIFLPRMKPRTRRFTK